MEAYNFSFDFVPSKDGVITSDIKFPKGIDKIGPEQARVAQIIAAYALHFAGVISEKTGKDYHYGIEKSVETVDELFSDAEFEILK